MLHPISKSGCVQIHDVFDPFVLVSLDSRFCLSTFDNVLIVRLQCLISIFTPQEFRFYDGESVEWAYGKIPVDEPACGFRREKCIRPNSKFCDGTVNTVHQ